MEENTQRFGEISLKAGTKAEVPFLDLSKIFVILKQENLILCDELTGQRMLPWQSNLRSIKGL